MNSKKLIFSFLTCFGVILSFIVHQNSFSQSPSQKILDKKALLQLGYSARAYPEQRDASIQIIAEQLKQLAESNIKELQRRQRDFQEPLLLFCDGDIINTLSPHTIKAVDPSLEKALYSVDLKTDTRWNPLSYVYGFFNRNVSLEEIEEAVKGWHAIPKTERARFYPSYVHYIDSVCKPLTMGPLNNQEDTKKAFDLALPLLIEFVLQEPLPGTAFHPPTHSALILGPLFDRWSDSEEYGETIKKHLGTRKEFIQMLSGQLVGSRVNRFELTSVEYGYFSYTGRYFANVLARLNAQSAKIPLQKSLEVYITKGSSKSTISYTKRALLGLGDNQEWEKLHSELKSPLSDKNFQTLIWLSRNCRGETIQYVNQLLAAQLNCPPDKVLQVYFENQLKH